MYFDINLLVFFLGSFIFHDPKFPLKFCFIAKSLELLLGKDIF